MKKICILDRKISKIYFIKNIHLFSNDAIKELYNMYYFSLEDIRLIIKYLLFSKKGELILELKLLDIMEKSKYFFEIAFFNYDDFIYFYNLIKNHKLNFKLIIDFKLSFNDDLLEIMNNPKIPINAKSSIYSILLRIFDINNIEQINLMKKYSKYKTNESMDVENIKDYLFYKEFVNEISFNICDYLDETTLKQININDISGYSFLYDELSKDLNLEQLEFLALLKDSYNFYYYIDLIINTLESMFKVNKMINLEKLLDIINNDKSKRLRSRLKVITIIKRLKS